MSDLIGFDIPRYGRGVARHKRVEFPSGRIDRVFPGVLGLGSRSAGLIVDDEQIDARMGWALRSVVPVANVAGIIAGQRPFVGWGVHGWRVRWLVRGSVQQPVGLRTLTVSLADDTAFLHALGLQALQPGVT